MSNESLRQKLKQQRAELDDQARQIATQSISEQVINSPIFQESESIAAYIPLKNEVDTEMVIDAIWQQEKQCYIPMVNQEHGLDFVYYDKSIELINSEHGIKIPKGTRYLAANELDLVILPMVGFTKSMHRIGMGAGHYDRTFAFLNQTPRPKKPFLMGIAFACQQCDSFEVQDWDISVNEIISA